MLPAHLQNLNPEQRAAVESIDGPLLILAGAGSGKTRTLTRRVAHLLFSGVKPWKILAVTFTNKAAAEMRERLVEMVGNAARDVWVATFHSTCVRILRQDAETLGYSRNFVIYDTDDQKRLMRTILEDLKIDKKEHPPAAFLSQIDSAKNKLMDTDEIVSRARSGEFRHHLEEIYPIYQKRLRAAQAMDFNDLINHVVHLFKTHPPTLARWQDRFRYLLVDEYQDTNHAQYQLVKLLGAKHRNVSVVGDDDQSIYAFRGADIRNILSFEKDFPEAKVVILDQNYRSTDRILKAAAAVVGVNEDRKEKVLWTDRGEGKLLARIDARDEEAEANAVITQIASLISQGHSPGEIAIIYRTNARSRLFEMALRNKQIPYVIVGARKFYERREVKDLLAYLRLVVNPADDMSFLRAVGVPRRGVGAKKLEQIRARSAELGVPMLAAGREVAKEGGRGAKGLARFCDLISATGERLNIALPGELLHQLAEDCGILEMLRAEDTVEAQGRLQNLEALCRDLAAFESWQPDENENGNDPIRQIQEFLDRSSLTGQDENLPDGGSALTLLTAHLAKGLEFPIVFVVSMVEGAFPHSRSSERQEDLAEERRLAYVAFTRAMDQLTLTTHRLKRSWQGYGHEPVSASRFLDDIPNTLFGGIAPPVRRRTISSPEEARKRRESFAKRHGIPTRSAPPEDLPDVSLRSDLGPRITREPESYDDLAPGVRVLHPHLGEGVIQRRIGSHQRPRLVIDFQGVGRKTVIPQYARLEIVEG